MLTAAAGEDAAGGADPTGPGVVARRAAVLGRPIGHSRSPVLHNAGYAAAGLTGWSYTAIECAEDELAALVAGLDESWAGLSLTMPLKEAALVVADQVAPLAAAVGAANTLVRRDGGTWYADNTDVPGMVAALATVAGMSTVETVAVLGAGGTARAALAAAARLGADRVFVYARRPAAIARLAPVATAVGVPLTGLAWSAVDDCVTADLVIAAVPTGVDDGLTLGWRPAATLLDVRYDPWPTRLAAGAAAAGCRVVSGLDLLLAQAVGQFEAFTGVPAPVEAMRRALLAAGDG